MVAYLHRERIGVGPVRAHADGVVVVRLLRHLRDGRRTCDAPSVPPHRMALRLGDELPTLHTVEATELFALLHH